MIKASFFPPATVAGQNRALQVPHREHVTGTKQTLRGCSVTSIVIFWGQAHKIKNIHFWKVT
jgi:hypothetical protein